jgi:hypothetical protein
MIKSNPFKWRHYQSEIILLCVRWYLRYALSYRDLEEMLEERGLSIDNTMIYRWVQRYAPELDKRSLSPSRQAGLLPPSPLGTDREGLPSISSSLSNAPLRTRFHHF